MLESWLDSANGPQTDFPLQNLPFGVFKRGKERPSIGVAIGDRVLDLQRCAAIGLLSHALAPACASESLNDLMSLGRPAWSPLRQRLTELLESGSPDRARVESCLVPLSEAVMQLPAAIGDYTDFYASVYHATNVGALFRPDNPLLPNYKYVPIGYHGRASSIVVSGTPIHRPSGQIKDPNSDRPTFGPTRSLDYELEVGFFTGPPNTLGQPIPIDEAAPHIFGLCLVNDWSARDIQAWEYQPLGPFLAKNFATTISPWIVTLDALAPFRVPAFERPAGDPEPLPYLYSPQDRESGGIDLTLEVYLKTSRMAAAVLLSRGNFRDLYWTVAQLLAHHASNGCNLRPGDLLASGTVSGPAQDSLGCLLEITRRGADPLQLPSGETRTFLADGDEIIFRAYCQCPSHPRIGFGECRGTVLPASR